MKIDVNSGYGIYNKKLTAEAKTVKSGSPDGGKKTSDVVDISRGNTAIADKSLVALKSNIQRDVSLNASAERIGQLQSAIKNGTYYIPTEALVNSILTD